MDSNFQQVARLTQRIKETNKINKLEQNIGHVTTFHPQIATLSWELRSENWFLMSDEVTLLEYFVVAHVPHYWISNNLRFK